jgi:lipopolysaccharide export system protein LptA
MSKRYFRNNLLIIIISALLMAAAPAVDRVDKNVREPIAITSHRMDADKLGDKVVFTGNVILKKEGMTLSSDSMVVFYDAGSKSIREIEAYGNVVVRKEGREAHSNRASYFDREEKIVLTGDPRINENENQLGGDKITLFLRDDRSIVEGGKVLLFQDKKGGSSDARKSK